MRLFFKSKDGGPESNVTGYWLIESKSLFSVVLLRFSEGTREAYHDHAFDALSWVLSGALYEKVLAKGPTNTSKYLLPSILPIVTLKNRFHKVYGLANVSWVISFRGPWNSTWQEYNDKTGFTTLTNGRKVVDENSNNRQSS